MLSQSSLKAYWSPRCTGPWATVSLHGAGKVTVRPAIIPAVKALNTVLAAYKYPTRYADTGAYNCRLTASGSWSLHAYGIAMDINWQSNPYNRTLRTDMLRYGDGRMPHRICAIRTNNGKQVWNWGGFWSGSKDAMHYEIVCSPADLRTGINMSTVYGGASTPAPKPDPEPEPEEANLMYRIVWFKGEPSAPGDQLNVTAAYRCVYAKREKFTGSDPYLCVEGWWIKDADVQSWRDRGLLEANKKTSPAPLRSTIAFHNGPFDNSN